MRSHIRPLLILCFTFSSLMGAMMLLPASTQGTIGGALTAQVTQDGPPPGPVLLEPVGGKVTNKTPSFKWKAVPGATRYYFNIFDYSLDGAQVKPAPSEVTNTSVTLPQPLAAGHIYMWSVMAQGGTSTNTHSRGFFSVAGVAPGDDPYSNDYGCEPHDLIPSLLHLRFRWGGGGGPYNFRLYGLTDYNAQGFPNMPTLFDTTTLGDGYPPSFAPNLQLDLGRLYSWSVWGKDNNRICNTSFLTTSSLSPATFELIGPSGNLTTPTTTFTWTEVLQAKYELRVVDLTIQKAMTVSNLSSTSYTPPVAFKPGHTYAWMVLAKKPATPSNPAVILKSDPAVFSISALASPKLQEPNGVVSAQPTFRWRTEVQDASSYDVVLMGLDVSLTKRQNVTTNSWQVPSPLPKGTYSWVVIAKGSAADVATAISTPMMFVVQ